MIIDLDTVENSPLPFEFSVTPDEIDLEDEAARLKNDVKVRGVLKKGIVQTEVAGTIETVIDFDCTRCLNPLEKNISVDFETAFVSADNYTQAKDAELNSDDLTVSVLEGNEIDLKELAREQILLNLPEQVFCSEDCKGLCPKCGANRNLIDCKCIENEVDPRWAALRDLKSKN